VAITQGELLSIDLRPRDSGSTGYHWRVANKPARSVLRFDSNLLSSFSGRQLLSYRARRTVTPGITQTSLALDYVGPGRGARIAKTFRLDVFVNESPPKFDCDGYPQGPRSTVGPQIAGFTTFATSSTSSLFKGQRTVVVTRKGNPRFFSYDAYYGCEFAQYRAYGLHNGGERRPAPDRYVNLSLRGNVAAYVYRPTCPFSFEGDCPAREASVEAQDLHTGRLIRSVPVAGGVNPSTVSGLVVSRAGGVAWLEIGAVNRVLRSDAPAGGGQAIASDAEVLAAGNDIDPDSLGFDGTDVTWVRGGTPQRAPLR
jgi:hypothetical protein